MNERIIEQMRKMEDVHGLIKVYHSYDNEKIRLWALEALADIHDPEVVPTIAEALSEDEDEDVRSFAAHALSLMKNAHAGPVLIDALLSDPSGQVRSKATYSLGRLKVQRAAKVLISALKDEHIAVRRNAAQALGMIGDLRAEKSLLEMINTEPDQNVRANIIKALGKLKSILSIEHISKLLHAPQDKIVRAAIEALGWIGDKDCLEILKAFQDTEIKPLFRAELASIISKLEQQLLIEPAQSDNTDEFIPSMNKEKVDYKKILDRLNKIGTDG